MPPRTPGITHRRNTGHFGMGIGALCGEKERNVKLTTVPKHVTCLKCRQQIKEMRAAAQERAARL